MPLVLDGEQLTAIAEAVAEILDARQAALDPVLTVARAAELLGVTEKTVRNMLSDGRLTRHGAPRRPLVSREQVTRLALGDTPARTSPGMRRRAPAGFRLADRSD
ncbi:MAG: helix-turn-helix domain-containing protein [Thermoleophilia bacterium]